MRALLACLLLLLARGASASGSTIGSAEGATVFTGISTEPVPYVQFSEGWDALLGVDYSNVWSRSVTGSGASAVQDGGILQLTVSSAAVDSVDLKSLAGYKNSDVSAMESFRAWVNFTTATHVNLLREFGAYNQSGSDGFGIQVSGAQASVVVRRASVGYKTNIPSLSDTAWHLLEIKVQNGTSVVVLVDKGIVYSSKAVSGLLVNDKSFSPEIRMVNSGALTSTSSFFCAHISVADEAGAGGVLSKAAAVDDTGISRLFMSDTAGRMISADPSIQGILNTLEYPFTSTAPIAANMWTKALSYSIPAGFYMQLRQFDSASSVANYPSRIVSDMYMGQYNANTNAFSQGNFFDSTIGQYRSSLEAEVTTVFVGTCTLIITYTNQSNSGGRVGTVNISTVPIVGAKFPMTLQAGDFGIKAITNVSRSRTTTGVVSLRGITELAYNYNASANSTEKNSFDGDGLYIPVGVTGTINLEFTASSLAVATRRLRALYSLILKKRLQ